MMIGCRSSSQCCQRPSGENPEFKTGLDEYVDGGKTFDRARDEGLQGNERQIEYDYSNISGEIPATQCPLPPGM